MSTPENPVETPELVDGRPSDADGAETESINQPGKLLRIGSMVKQLLDEVRQSELDEPSRERLKEIYETSIDEIGSALSEDLKSELGRLAHPFAGQGVPSEAELRIAKAQLVGWLEGLFHGIQATLFAQQMAARQQLEEMRSLPPGMQGPGGQSRQDPPSGTYL